MKKIAILTVSLYQNVLVVPLKSILGVNNCCRFEVSCSEYSKRAIEKWGVIKGTYLSIVRLLKCQPFYNLQ